MALSGHALKLLADEFAVRFAALDIGSNIGDADIYSAASDAMKNSGEPHATWCDRCRVLSLHQPTFTPVDPQNPTVREMFQHCVTDPVMTAVLGVPPDASGRIDAASCTACAANEVSDDSGTCVACPTDIHGDECLQCPSDVVLDANTLALDIGNTLDTTLSAPGDSCPETFFAEVDNPQQAFTRGAVVLDAVVGPSALTSAGCERTFSLVEQRSTGGTFVAEQSQSGTGAFNTCSGSGGICIESCEGLPAIDFTTSTVGAGNLRYGTLAGDPTRTLTITASTTPVVRVQFSS